MSDVIVCKGAISYPITLDPSVWIFDDRKINLADYNGEEADDTENSTLTFIKGTGAQWDKELREGAALPSERPSLTEQRKALEGDYAMRLAYFIENAQPDPSVSKMVIHREQGDKVTLSLADAKRAILQFSKDGKPIREGGPVYLYLPETWKKKEPIDQITVFEFVKE
ncbi:hypothetical protein [Brevibacillus fulvus]|uniref:Peptidyl-prolyl cis-trans isomerase n=1 Tax=Brevibacillus fulvus TaxID=1125967 RepID=A0A939BQM3_9BACL|nr:hypothetical protein [Brevibacillus fulvus]MBM7588528.1 hypothetical protein [Brevibacillus fulvus]